MIDNQVIHQIAAIDDAFEPLISKFPNYPLIKSEIPINSPFVSLVETIISQQLSGKAAQTIANRLREKIQLSPKEISAADTNLLRSVGLSGAKVRTIHELAGTVLAGLDLDDLSNKSATEIRSQLIAIWGIGNWTVDMFLMFDLYEPDIWPINDLGVQKGWQLLHGLAERPTPAELLTAGEKFAGFRSPVAWYCWRALEVN